MATTDSFFALIGAHPVWHSRWVNERGKPAFQKPLTAEKQSIKHQLYATHVGAVGWEPHSSSTMTCAGKVDHKLPVNQSKGHTYTNPRPRYYLMHVHSHIMRAGGQPWAAVSPILGLNSMAWPLVSDQGNLGKKTLSYRGESFKYQFHTTHVGAIGPGNCTAALPRHAWGRQITGLVYVCPLL